MTRLILVLTLCGLAACTTYGKNPEASGDTATTTKSPPTTGGTAPQPANVIAGQPWEEFSREQAAGADDEVGADDG